jgi:3-hydroxybutyryl-CoA dehydratase
MSSEKLRVWPKRYYPTVAEAKVGDRYAWSATFTHVNIEKTGEATGDMNPVHFDEVYAARTRFKRTILHGAALFGEISRVLGMEFPGRGTIFVDAHTKFLNPVYPGSTVSFVATIDERDVERSRLVIGIVAMVDDTQVAKFVCTVFLQHDPQLEMAF